MEHYSKFLKGIALSALASAILWGSALAVPSPTYPSSPDPGSDAIVTGADAPSSATAVSAPGTRILSRSDSLSGAARFRGGTYSGVSGMSPSSTSSRWKNRYLMSGLVLATLTPLVLHRSGEPGDKSDAVRTQSPGGSSLPSLGGNGNGNGRGNGGRGGGDDEGDHPGDNGSDEEGEDDGGNGGDVGDGNGGGDDGGGGALPEPGTVPLIGAGLITALALRSRRDQ